MLTASMKHLNVTVILSSNYYKKIKIKRNVKESAAAGKNRFGTRVACSRDEGETAREAPERHFAMPVASSLNLLSSWTYIAFESGFVWDKVDSVIGGPR